MFRPTRYLLKSFLHADEYKYFAKGGKLGQVHFDDKIRIYKFFTPGCGPCKKMQSWFSDWSDEKEDLHPHLNIYEVNLKNESNKFIAKNENITHVPLIMFVKGTEKIVLDTDLAPEILTANLNKLI